MISTWQARGHGADYWWGGTRAQVFSPFPPPRSAWDRGTHLTEGPSLRDLWFERLTPTHRVVNIWRVKAMSHSLPCPERLAWSGIQ